jgi:hypothetical protein
MAGLFDEELERQRQQLQEAGVTPEMVEMAGLLPVAEEAPKHWTEKARERDGNGKFFGKMLLGGLTGTTPFLFPEMFGAKERYKAEMSTYVDAQERMRELEALQGIDPQNPGVAGIQIASEVNKNLGDFYTDRYVGNQNRDTWAGRTAAKLGMSYKEFMEMDVGTREALIWQNSSPEERTELDYVAGRQTPEQAANQAKLVTTATEEAKAEVQTAQTDKSQAPQMQVAFDTLNDVLNKGDYHNIYGVMDSRTPDVRQSSQDVKTQMEKVGAILYMFARGELKGQGQVTEDEAKWAMKSRSSLMDFKQGDEAARAEMMLIQRQLGEKLGIEDESMYYGYKPSIDDLVDQYAD